MESHSETNKRIAKNTIILYLRMMVMMVIGFFTARITLSALGVENYGIYNVVGGLVSMFSLISGSLSAAIARFITYGLGLGDANYLRKIFGASMNIQILLALIVTVLLESVGLWFLNYHLEIPDNRMFAANVVFQLSVLSFALSLISMPYNATIVAHEKMSAFAYMTLFEAGYKLIIVISLLYVDTDKLILYAALLVAQGLISQLIYWKYCHSKFSECRYSLVRDKKLYKEIFNFSGWNFIGCTAALLSDQGVNIALNLFFGPLVNAGRAIGMQVNSILTQFSGNFMTALSPQITKTYASNDLLRMHSLIMRGSKFSFFLFLILSIPVLIETPQALQIWLGQIPQHSVSFARLAILLTWSNIISSTLITAQLATGKIRNYQIAVGGTYLLNLPLSCVVLKLGASAPSVMIVAIIISQICLFLRLWLLRSMIHMSMIKFIKAVYLKAFVVTIASLPIPLGLYFLIPASFSRLVIVTAVSVAITSANVYIFGCDTTERQKIRNQVNKLKHRLCPT